MESNAIDRLKKTIIPLAKSILDACETSSQGLEELQDDCRILQGRADRLQNAPRPSKIPSTDGTSVDSSDDSTDISTDSDLTEIETHLKSLGAQDSSLSPPGNQVAARVTGEGGHREPPFVAEMRTDALEHLEGYNARETRGLGGSQFNAFNRGTGNMFVTNNTSSGSLAPVYFGQRQTWN